MEKASKNVVFRYVHYICIFSLVCSPFPCLADHSCDCTFCVLDEEFDDFINYEELREYKGIYHKGTRLLNPSSYPSF